MPPAAVFAAGLVIVLLGAEMVLRAAARIANRLRVPPILIGLTVVSVGTSVPELGVGLAAVAENKGPLAVGNIAGTNMLNILFILGLSALIRPLPTRMLSVRLDVPVMIASALALVAMAWDGRLDRGEGSMLLIAAVLYTVALIHLSRAEGPALQREFSQEFGREFSQEGAPAPAIAARQGILEAPAAQGVLLAAGIALTLVGADLLVNGASSMARTWGVSDAFIGLTVVAIGTSAPELATTLLATLKNDRDVAIGNLIGSSIYNILVILGLTVVAAPGGVEVGSEVLRIDLPLAALVALVCLPVFRSEGRVSRSEGAVFVIAYLVYLALLLFVRH
ncbi:MAG: calcium/sodium antiporter [Methyloversatilis sp.]|nr:calcium/sodium antiporter [Methyloversatilis sp.]